MVQTPKLTIAVTMATSFMACSGGSVFMVVAGTETLQPAVQSSTKRELTDHILIQFF